MHYYSQNYKVIFEAQNIVFQRFKDNIRHKKAPRGKVRQ